MPIARKQWKHKKRKPFETRKEESENIHSLFPKSIPVILERASNSIVPAAEKEKFLIPRCQTYREFELLVKRKLLLTPDMRLHLCVGENIPKNSDKMGDLFEENSDEDGFLYVSYYIDKMYDAEESHGRIL